MSAGVCIVHKNPGGYNRSIDLRSNHNAVVEEIRSGGKTLQPVNGREVTKRVGEGNEFSVNAIPVAGGGTVGRVWGHVGDQSCLGSGVCERVGSTVGENVFLWHFQGRIACGEFVEAPPSGSGLDADGVSAEAVVVPEPGFQCPVCKDRDGLVLLGVMGSCVLPQ